MNVSCEYDIVYICRSTLAVVVANCVFFWNAYFAFVGHPPYSLVLYWSRSTRRSIHIMNEPKYKIEPGTNDRNFICCYCCLHVKPLFLPNDNSSTPSQCPSWFILERYKFCGHRQCDREKPNAKDSRYNVPVGKPRASVPGTREQEKTPPEK